MCIRDRIYIGMNDNGKVVGVADADKLLEDIPNKVRDVLGIIVDVNQMCIRDRPCTTPNVWLRTRHW